MFDKLLGSMSRRAENRTRDKALKTVRELQGHLRTLTGSCRILIEARTNGVDSLAQIEALDWQRFAVAVARAEVLGRPETVDRTAELIERHRTVKLFAGAFLNTFEFRGAGAVQGLLSALTIIAELYRTGKRRLPDRVPLRFVPSAWRPFVLRDGIVDRAAYELCALSQLRERLRAGDIWVSGSRQFRDFACSPPMRSAPCRRTSNCCSSRGNGRSSPPSSPTMPIASSRGSSIRRDWTRRVSSHGGSGRDRAVGPIRYSRSRLSARRVIGEDLAF